MTFPFAAWCTQVLGKDDSGLAELAEIAHGAVTAQSSSMLDRALALAAASLGEHCDHDMRAYKADDGSVLVACYCTIARSGRKGNCPTGRRSNSGRQLALHYNY